MRGLVILLLAGLADAAEPPPWFTSRAVDAAGSVCGLGAGSTAAEARQTALADLVEQLVVSVASERILASEQRATTAGDASTVDQKQEFRQTLRSSTALRDLAGVEVVRQEGGDGGWYVAIAIPRDKLAAQAQGRIGELDRLLAGGPAETPALPDSGWVARQRALLAAAGERESLAAILTAQGTAPAHTPLAAAVVRARLGGLAKLVVLRTEGGEAVVDCALATVAGDLGLTLAAPGGTATHRISGTVTRSDSTTARGWFRVALAGEVTVTTTDGGIIGRIRTEGVATSTKDAEQAARLAGGELARRLAEAMRSQLLLILLRNRPES